MNNMKCPKCGKEIADDSQFCEFCGEKVSLIYDSAKLPDKEPRDKKTWILVLLSTVILILTGWLVYEHMLRNQVSDSLRLVQEQAEADVITIDSLQNIISQTDDKILLMNDDNFEDFLSMSSEHIVIIDYYGKWCAPCRKLDPILYEIIKEYHGRVFIGRYIVDDWKERYVKNYNVTGIPTLIFVADGVEKKRIVGFDEETKENIVKTIDFLLKSRR